jgi:hypothetical protein
MGDSSSIFTFIIVSFAFALVLILKKDTLAPQFKRYLALFAILMIVTSFILIVYSFLNAG